MKILTLRNVIIIVLLLWIVLTLFVQFFGSANKKVFKGSDICYVNALIIYNPDPINDFDLKVCKSFAKGLLENNIESTIISVKHKPIEIRNYDLIVFCANTYNFNPDWGIQKIIQKQNLKHKYVANINLGAGSTAIAEKKLNELVVEKGAVLLGSHSFWLLKPNDESVPNKNNVDIALDQSKAWASEISKALFDLDSNKSI